MLSSRLRPKHMFKCILCFINERQELIQIKLMTIDKLLPSPISSDLYSIVRCWLGWLVKLVNIYNCNIGPSLTQSHLSANIHTNMGNNNRHETKS